ncbi:conserved hypothetical protein [Actinacidiphila bryophytorum]|uniref:Uncharacterized protein n=1 Tax=Actinacidiphila bryophytorum TaxID=1436133 RepID=A0A9W4H370_9ACTN|nr:conserved hypothetical protein [Actinacidiphila bryophytorum]
MELPADGRAHRPRPAGVRRPARRPPGRGVPAVRAARTPHRLARRGAAGGRRLRRAARQRTGHRRPVPAGLALGPVRPDGVRCDGSGRDPAAHLRHHARTGRGLAAAGTAVHGRARPAVPRRPARRARAGAAVVHRTRGPGRSAPQDVLGVERGTGVIAGVC